MFAARGVPGARRDVVHTVAIDAELLGRAWDVYRNDPTIWACQRIMNGLLAEADLTFLLRGKPLELSEEFRLEHKRAYLEALGDVFDCIRVQGFVPYVIEPSNDEGAVRQPIVPPYGTFSFQCVVDPLHRVQVEMQSVYAVGRSVADARVFVVSAPDLHGTPSSVIVPLLTELEEYRAMKAAAVEDQVKKARATLITQERRYGGGAPTTDASATALNDLNMFLADGTGDLVSQRIDDADSGRLQQLSAQVRRARAINARALEEEGDGPPGDSLNANLLALPKDQELCSSAAPPAPQDVIRHRKHLEYQITSSLGVPALLLMPGNSAYKVDDMVLRATNTEVRRLCKAASAFFTKVFRETYRGNRKRPRGRPPGAAGLRREAQSVQAQIDEVEVQIEPPPFLTVEAVQAFASSNLFKPEYTAELMAKALGIYNEGSTEANIQTSNTPAAAAPPAAVEPKPPPVVRAQAADPRKASSQ